MGNALPVAASSPFIIFIEIKMSFNIFSLILQLNLEYVTFIQT